jgi:toxin ParE1/3/4
MFAKNLTYRLSPLSESDLEGIWFYTFQQWSLEQADDYHKSIMKAIEGLASGRNVWQKSNVREGYWKYPVGRHVIFFRNPDGFLDVIRILHEKTDMSPHLDIDSIAGYEDWAFLLRAPQPERRRRFLNPDIA